MLLTRLARLMKSNNGLFYVVVGTLNVLVGIFCIALYSLGEADMPWLNKCLWNLLVGTFITIDIFVLKSIVNPDQSKQSM